jgi:hypothetical protein
MTLSPTFLIFRTGFAPTNGSSVQMIRLLAPAQESLVHLMWDAKEAGGSSVPFLINTDDDVLWKRPFGRVGRAWQRWQKRTGRSWWDSGRLNAAKLTRALSDIPLKPRQAYMTCGREWDAERAFALWGAAGSPPYVLHVFDILDSEFSETKTPCFVRLVRNASHVLCLNRIIEKEIKIAGADATSLFSLCSDIVPTIRTMPPGPLKMIISGALYKDLFGETQAMKLLREGWSELAKVFPGAELHYSGASSWGLPDELRPLVHNHGLLDADEYRKLLNSCHVAYVPVSHANNTAARFSLPSRIPDYLISGLPVIACTTEGTGIYEFFQSTPRQCTRMISDANEFLSAVREFAGDAALWEKASNAAVAYSKDMFAVPPAQEKLFGYINAAGSLKPAVAAA